MCTRTFLYQDQLLHVQIYMYENTLEALNTQLLATCSISVTFDTNQFGGRRPGWKANVNLHIQQNVHVSIQSAV